MTSITPFKAMDLLNMNHVNLDILTENFYVSFYLEYLSRWPTLCFKTESPATPLSSGNPICTGYMLGKVEGRGKEWHSHITAVTVAWDYRRMGLAKTLVKELADRSEDHTYNAWFMDLFVRSTNALAIKMYRGLGFDIFRRIKDYYSSDGIEPSEDAFGKYRNYRLKRNLYLANRFIDMRLPLKRDVNRDSLIGASDK